MRSGALDSALLVIAAILTLFVVLTLKKDLTIRILLIDPQARPPVWERSKPELQALWDGQEVALGKRISLSSGKALALRTEALSLSHSEGPLRLPGNLLDFCSRSPALPLLFLRSGSAVAAVCPNRQQLQRLFHLIKAFDTNSLGKVQLFWNVFASVSARDEALNQRDNVMPPAVHLDNFINVFPEGSVLTLRFCLQQLDGFLFDSSVQFFARFKVSVIVTQDCSDVRMKFQRVVAAELRGRTYMSVGPLLREKGFRPFLTSGEAIKAAPQQWPATVHWERSS